MNGKKDRSLNIIFENCIEESPAPNQGVIDQAIALLEEKNTINDRAVSDHKRRSYTFFKKRYFKIGLSVGLSMCLCLAVCFGLLFSRNIKSSAQKVVQRSEVVQNAVHTQFQDSDFLSFVEEDSVTDYREHELSDQSEYYKEYGDSVIFYYLQYVDRGTDIELFVGVDWFVFDQLLGFSEIENGLELDEIYLLIELDLENAVTYAFIDYDRYQYYFIIYTLDDDAIVSILENIVLCL